MTTFERGAGGDSFEALAEVLAPYVIDSDDDLVRLSCDGEEADLFVEYPDAVSLGEDAPPRVHVVVEKLAEYAGWRIQGPEAQQPAG